MSKVTVVDEWIKTEDGNDIFTKTWKAISTPIATLVYSYHYYLCVCVLIMNVV